MLLAVLEKRCGLPFGSQDVFLNIAGGIKVADPAIDLSIVAALISSLQDIPLRGNICFAGEVGLSGEIRAISRIDQRIQEADRLGMETIYISKYNKGIDQKDYKVEIKLLSTVIDLLESIFEY
jgi:DNA repair protein RadA/Sms